MAGVVECGIMSGIFRSVSCVRFGLLYLMIMKVKLTGVCGVLEKSYGNMRLIFGIYRVRR